MNDLLPLLREVYLYIYNKMYRKEKQRATTSVKRIFRHLSRKEEKR